MRAERPDRVEPSVPRLLSYVAELELEVDRLRKQGQFIRHQVRDALRRMQTSCAEADPANALVEIERSLRELSGLLRDAQEPPGYHPAHDQVIAVALRPLAEQVFRWQQRLESAAEVDLHLELESEYVEWFPARLRHILENLISNALRFRDPSKERCWVRLGLRISPDSYELWVSDNGVGLASSELGAALVHRSAAVRAAGLGVGLAVVRLLVEQSGGTLTADSGEGAGSTFVAVLPRYEVDDYLV